MLPDIQFKMGLIWWKFGMAFILTLQSTQQTIEGTDNRLKESQIKPYLNNYVNTNINKSRARKLQDEINAFDPNTFRNWILI